MASCKSSKFDFRVRVSVDAPQKGNTMLLVIGLSIIIATVTAFIFLVTIGFWVMIFDEPHPIYIFPALIFTGVCLIVLYIDNIFINYMILEYWR